jgi:hypothetical protein
MSENQTVESADAPGHHIGWNVMFAAAVPVPAADSSTSSETSQEGISASVWWGVMAVSFMALILLFRRNGYACPFVLSSGPAGMLSQLWARAF